MVNVYDLVDIVNAAYSGALAGLYLCAVFLQGKRFVQYLVYKARFAAAGNSGDAGYNALGDIYINVFKIVLGSAAYVYKALIGLAALGRNGDFPLSAQVLSGERLRAGTDILDRSCRDDITAVHARSGAYINDVVGSAHGVLIVLDDYERIAEIAQILKRFQKLLVIALVQADARLIEDIQHPRERSADLRCKPYALALAARERRRAAREAKILKSDIFEKAEARLDLFKDPVGNYMLFFAQLERLDKFYRFGHGHIAHARYVNAADRDGKRLLAQALSMAFRAGDLGHALFYLGAHGRALRLEIPALKVFAYTLERAREFACKRAVFPLTLVAEVKLFALAAVKENVLHAVGQFGYGRIKRKAVFFGKRVIIHCRYGVRARAPAGGFYGSAVDAQAVIGDDEIRIDKKLHAQAVALGTCAVRRIEREHARSQLFDGYAAVGAGIVLREEYLTVFADNVGNDKAVCKRGRRFHGIGKTAHDTVLYNNAVDNDLDGVLFVLIELNFLGKLVHAAVNAHADIARAARILEHLDILALARTNDRRKYHELCSLGKEHELVDYLIYRLLPDLLAALGAVGLAYASPEKAHIVV